MKQLINTVTSLLGLIILVMFILVIVSIMPKQQDKNSLLSFISPVSTVTPTLDQFAKSPIATPSPQLHPPVQSTETATKWIPTTIPTPIRSTSATPTPLPLPVSVANVDSSIWFLAKNESTQIGLYSRHFDSQKKQFGHDVIMSFQARSITTSQGHEAIYLYSSQRGQYIAIVEFAATDIVPRITLVNTIIARSFVVIPPNRDNTIVSGEFGNWHPDGRHFLYIGSNNRTGLWLLDAENKDTPQYLSEHTPDAVAVSPDGQNLLFSERPVLSNKSELWHAWADGSHEQKLFDVSARSPIFGLSWSPDGSKFVYLQSNTILIANADGTGRRELSRNWASGWGFPPPAWSPDGKFIVFPAQEIAPEKKDPQIYSDTGAFRYVNVHILNIRTGEEKQLIPDGSVGNLYPSWSPDGSMIAFLSNRSGTSEIWVIDQNGKNLQQLTTTNTWHSAPVWLSQGKAE